MRLILALFVLVAIAIVPHSSVRAANPILPGPHKAGVTNVTITRPDESTFTAELYYPALAPGADAAFDASGGAYPIISFGHGFFQQPWRYSGTMKFLASHGYFVIATQSETGLFPDHAAMADDMSSTIDYLETRGTTAGDAFQDHVQLGNAGLSGHSMGAGVSLLAAAQDSRVKTVADLAVAITRPSPIPLLEDLNIPIALLAGSDDAIVPISSGTLPVYEAAGAPKAQVILDGGSHVGFQDFPFPLFGDEGALPVATQTLITRAYLSIWFDLYLKGDQTYWREIWGPEALTKELLSVELDPGVTLSAANAVAGATPGETTTFLVTLTNTGPIANSFSLFADDSAWNAELSATETPTLAPGESFQFNVTLDVPGTLGQGESDSLLLSARSNNDGGTRGYTLLSASFGTVAVPEPATWMMLISAAVGLAALAGRKGRHSSQ